MSEYYMLHKPGGCITARSDPRHKTVMDYLPEEKRHALFPVGRLDKDTEGLLIITDDGELCASLLHPDSKTEKTYFFYALGALDEAMRDKIEEGIRLYPTKDIISMPAKVEIDGAATLGEIKSLLSPLDLKRANRRPETPVFYGRVTVTEGKKHQIKRMLLFGGCRVVYLKRLGMGGITLDESLPKGSYRPLTANEILILKRLSTK